MKPHTNLGSKLAPIVGSAVLVAAVAAVVFAPGFVRDEVVASTTVQARAAEGPVRVALDRP